MLRKLAKDQFILSQRLRSDPSGESATRLLYAIKARRGLSREETDELFRQAEIDAYKPRRKTK